MDIDVRQQPDGTYLATVKHDPRKPRPRGVGPGIGSARRALVEAIAKYNKDKQEKKWTEK